MNSVETTKSGMCTTENQYRRYNFAHYFGRFSLPSPFIIIRLRQNSLLSGRLLNDNNTKRRNWMIELRSK